MGNVKTKYSWRIEVSLHKDAIMLRWAFLHESTAWLCSQCITPMPERSLGENNGTTTYGYAVLG